MSYIVQWEDEFGSNDEDEDITLNNPLDAAKMALSNLQKSETLGFTVINTITNKKYSVDLSETDEYAVTEIKNKIEKKIITATLKIGIAEGNFDLNDIIKMIDQAITESHSLRLISINDIKIKIDESDTTNNT